MDDAGRMRYLSPEIAHLEKHFFSYPAPKWNGAGGGVTLAAAANPRAETEGVAREITALCRDAGYRYRDIIILLRDFDHYADLISSVFADHGIPVFIDQAAGNAPPAGGAGPGHAGSGCFRLVF